MQALGGFQEVEERSCGLEFGTFSSHCCEQIKLSVGGGGGVGGGGEGSSHTRPATSMNGVDLLSLK